jgi:hypothetical protein
MELEYRRPLPLELHAEIHKYLPLPDAIYVLVNVSSWEFVSNNSPRMRKKNINFMFSIIFSVSRRIYLCIGW